MAYYFDSNPDSKSCEQLIKCEINGSIYNFYTDNNVFSKKYLDFGTRTLLECIDTNDIVGDVLDFGCGSGLSLRSNWRNIWQGLCRPQTHRMPLPFSLGFVWQNRARQALTFCQTNQRHSLP